MGFEEDECKVIRFPEDILAACHSRHDYGVIVTEGACGTAGGYRDNSRMLIIDHIRAARYQELPSELTCQIYMLSKSGLRSGNSAEVKSYQSFQNSQYFP